MSADRISHLSLRGNAPVSSLVLRKAAALADLITELRELTDAGGHIDGAKVAARLSMLETDLTKSVAPEVGRLEALALSQAGVAL
jgi:hypothetical protein